MSSHLVTPNTEAAILARVIESDQNAITPDVARYLISMQLPAYWSASGSDAIPGTKASQEPGS